ncbi:MAG: amidohydrolase family protein [Acidimicrobiia bacterium]|nr:amidohydrolase family protein [Acidimicrobiia bacterium]
MDLVIRGGTVVTSGFEVVTDVGIDGGRIAQLGGEMRGDREIDAAGKVVLPGGVDLHVHLTPPSAPGGWAWADDFASGTAAALVGGVTTVGNMSHPHQGQGIAEGFERDAADGLANSRCDFLLHPIMMDPSEDEIVQMERFVADGHTSLKIFLSFRRFERNVAGYLEAMRRLGEAGGIAFLHCEDVGIVDCCCAMLERAGHTHPRWYPDARPVAAERAATERAVAFAEITGCPSIAVHLASAAALDACRAGQARGTKIYVETRPLYLHLSRERFDEPDGAKYGGAPPLRDKADVEALWAGIAQGTVTTIATDHAPWMLADKLAPENTATEMRLGVSELETSLPMLWWAGVATGRISRRRFVEIAAANPARIAGLYPRKGTIAPGSDADVLIWNPRATRIIDGKDWQSKADYSVYDGWEVTGWPETVVARGEIVVEAGRLTAAAAPGRGELLRRGPTQAI